MADKKKVSFPQFGEYNDAIRYVIEEGLGQEYVYAPAMTRKTMELGAHCSPDTVCTPFKSTLGSMIEALEAGADTLIMSYGWCRLGYYGELQEMILRDLGYDFDFVNLAEYTTGKSWDYLQAVKRFAPKIHPMRATKAAADAVKMIEYLDDITSEYYKICGFEVNKGESRRILRMFQHDMRHVHSRTDIERVYRTAKNGLVNLQLRKNDTPLRVGIIGEYFTVQDPFSNLNIEQTIADMGVEVYRWMNFTHRNVHYSGEKNMNIRIKDLVKYEMGPTSTANIWCARDYAERRFDGIIHVKSAGCTPEIDIMPVLQNIGRQYKIPILFLTFDTQTSDTGLQTRLEAFYDMIAMRKKVLR